LAKNKTRQQENNMVHTRGIDGVLLKDVNSVKKTLLELWVEEERQQKKGIGEEEVTV